MEIVNFNLNPDDPCLPTPVRKTRAVLHDEDKNIIIQNYNGILLFPGGKNEDDESDTAALRREVLEETGLVLANVLNPPFCVVNNYEKEYPHYSKGIIEHYVRTHYSEETVDLSNQQACKLSSDEKAGNFKNLCVHKDHLVEFIESHQTDNPGWYFAKREIASVALKFCQLDDENS